MDLASAAPLTISSQLEPGAPALEARQWEARRASEDSSCGLDVCPAVLQTRLSKAHTGALSAALVLQDKDDEKLIATTALDKGMAIWRFYQSEPATGPCAASEPHCDESIEVTRLKVPGAPVFSLAKIPDVLPDGTVQRRKRTGRPSGIYLGTAAKEVTTYMLGTADVTSKVVLGDHTGWVRALAVSGKWLFSCGCNSLRLWDTTFRTPKECHSVRLFTGDILSIAAGRSRVFTAGADGSLRSWAIVDHRVAAAQKSAALVSPKAADRSSSSSSAANGGGDKAVGAGGGGGGGGRLDDPQAVERAHEGRVAACVAHGGRVYTVSYDGSIKAWSATTLELLAEVQGAHRGEKVFCAAMGANGVLFTGGDDKLIRAWDSALRPLGPPLEGHASAVRVLAAGGRGLLVSGDAEGDVCMWETTPVELPGGAVDGSGGGRGGAAAGVAAPAGALQVALVEAARQELEDLYAPSCPAAEAHEAELYAAEAQLYAPPPVAVAVPAPSLAEAEAAEEALAAAAHEAAGAWDEALAAAHQVAVAAAATAAHEAAVAAAQSAWAAEPAGAVGVATAAQPEAEPAAAATAHEEEAAAAEGGLEAEAGWAAEAAQQEAVAAAEGALEAAHETAALVEAAATVVADEGAADGAAEEAVAAASEAAQAGEEAAAAAAAAAVSAAWAGAEASARLYEHQHQSYQQQAQAAQADPAAAAAALHAGKIGVCDETPTGAAEGPPVEASA